jgi:molybdenum cofactor synthesis domain-containing protein
VGSLEIICVGNELLIGKTLNTNATWLAKSVTSLGLMVKRITVVGDDVDEIARTLQEALARKPSVIITTGGLGPTFDDKTLEGIAKGLGRGLGVNVKALKMVRAKYEAYLKQRKIEKIELTAPRVKMATLPRGAEPLTNSVGTAPGVLVKTRGALIVALPGVPPEMEAIFTESLAEIIKNKAGASMFFEKSIYAEGIMESTLAPLIDQVMCGNSCVYIKSHVYTKSTGQFKGRKSHIELHFSTTADDAKIARNRLKEAIAQLSELVQEGGGKIAM